MTQYVQKSLLGSWYVEIPKDIASTFEDDVLSFFEIMFSSLPANKSKHLISQRGCVDASSCWS